MADTAKEKETYKYVGFGPGWSGGSNDLGTAVEWLVNNHQNGDIYLRLSDVLARDRYTLNLENMLDRLVHDLDEGFCCADVDADGHMEDCLVLEAKAMLECTPVRHEDTDDF